jgi:hypothetical protein
MFIDIHVCGLGVYRIEYAFDGKDVFICICFVKDFMVKEGTTVKGRGGGK